MSDTVAAAFEARRDRLHAVAHRLLGSHADAEDAVQEAWLRLARQDATAIENLDGWLTTVVGRISLDVLRSRKARPESPYDEIVVAVEEGPEADAELADSVGLALLVVLESLGPGERLAFVLHDLFAVPFEEIARILGKSPAAAKMLASRARRKVRTPSVPAGPSQREVVQAFLTAARDGDFEQLLRILDPEVRLTVDTPDGVVVVLGATNVAAGARIGAAADGSAVFVGGLPGVVAWRADGTPMSVVAFTVVDGRIVSIASVADPVKLASMALPEPPGTVGGAR
ncbi:sigma-70 family RNA polymerase sigma factor [Amycolatopsis vancoresmycina]|uniref:RNA polymerase sigma-70 factor, ECF subfamily protein n=1 Tax=Amycolatopsis vancoresmycina DSM 44592 TaxID=1292037 RepID=R1HAU7_9PSEU|nr:sigma-70 family RNA polymerase sigma factor [Amycolatopsis vancoresmycina]EOD60825.1 RNA polymerase sigma-70 factor, ECF subfamily protein [Amycolatopsis vancoresmycina DSM 44592]